LEYQLEEQSQSIEKGFLQGKINDLRIDSREPKAKVGL
jgi:hypothetical protein